MSGKGRSNDGLYKRNKYWYTKVKIDGVWVEKATRTSDYTEARRIRRDLQDAALAGAVPNDLRRTKLHSALGEWLNFQLATRKHGSHAHERTIVKNLLTGFGRDKRLDSFNSTDLRRYQQHRLAVVKPKTINNELQVLRTVLKLAKVWRSLEENYSPLKTVKSTVGRALTLAQARRLLEAGQTNDAWFVALLVTVLALHTGMRSYEIKSLRLSDLHPEEEVPYLRIIRDSTKTDAGVRDVALNENALWSINTLLSRAAQLGSVAPHHHLLPANLSKRTKLDQKLKGFDPALHQTSWTTAWRSLIKAADLPGFRFHDLRHSHISWALASGAPPETVRGQVGHSDIFMTLYYSHSSLFDKTAAVLRVQEHARAISSALPMQSGGGAE